MNPFVIARERFSVPCSGERLDAELDALLAEGFEAEGHHYRLFGHRVGRLASMSLGMPVLGGGAPVLRMWRRGDSAPLQVDMVVGARMEFMLLGSLWMLVTLVGGSYQLFLQWREVAAGRAGWSAVTDVLPGIGIMVAILVIGTTLFRRRAKIDARLLQTALSHCFATAAGTASPATFTGGSPYDGT